MRRYSIKMIQLLSVGLLAATFCFSQTKGFSKSVFFRVNVVDDKRQVVSNLNKDNFTVKEEGVEREITSFAVDEGAASVVILMDVSDSVEPEIRQVASQAALKFMKTSHGKNEYSIIAFGGKIAALTDWQSTDDEQLAALDKIPQFEAGQTDFYGACIFAMEKLNTGKNQKKVLLIFSDGLENAKSKKYKEVINQIKSSDFTIFSIAASKKQAETTIGFSAQDELVEIGELSGGYSYFPFAGKELDEIIERVAQSVKTQYIIGFQPNENAGKKDNWRTVKIKAEAIPDAKGKKAKLTVRAREGFYFTKPNE